MLTSNESIKNSKSRLVRISTEDLKTGTKGRFSVNISATGGSMDNVKGFMVHSIECPNVFDNIPTYANVLTLVKATGAVSYDVTIPNSYYYFTDLVTALQTAINGVIPDVVAIAKVGSAPTEKFAFTFTGDAYELKLASTVAGRLGLTADLTCPDGVQTTLQGIPNLIGETAIYVHSRTLAPNNLVEGSGSFSVVDKVDLDKPYGAMCYSNPGTESPRFKKYFPFESLKSLREVKITLRNRIGQVLILPDNFDFSIIIIAYHA